MPKVFRVVFCEFASSKLDDELSYYTELLGATSVLRTPDGAHYLSFGLDHHNIVLRSGESSGLLSTGLQLNAGSDLKQFSGELSTLGLQPELKTDSRPGVPELLEIMVAGHRFEFFSAREAPAPGFAAHGIAPNRLGHVALMTPDADALVTFFRDFLGFHITDWIEGVATFLTCNYDHHVMNIISAPITKLHHIAFELRGAGHQYQASDQLAKAQKPIVWGPSRHTAGHNYASYHFDPDRTLVELYTDMDIFLPDLGHFEARPWHEDLPQRPRVWAPDNLNAWNTNFDFDFRTA